MNSSTELLGISLPGSPNAASGSSRQVLKASNKMSNAFAGQARLSKTVQDVRLDHTNNASGILIEALSVTLGAAFYRNFKVQQATRMVKIGLCYQHRQVTSAQ